MKRISMLFRSFLTLCICLFTFTNADAVQITLLGPSTQTNPNLYGGISDYGPVSVSSSSATNFYRAAYIYQGAYFPGIVNGNSIVSLDFSHYSGALSNTGGKTVNLKIYMKNLADNDWGGSSIAWTTAVNNATLVYDGDPTSIVTAPAGWQTFPLNTPYVWNTTNGANLAILVECTQAGGAQAATVYYGYDWTAASTNAPPNLAYSNETLFSSSTSAAPTTLATTNTRRPVMRVDYITCPAVTNIVTSNIQYNGVTVGWNPVAGSQGYEYAVTTSATPPATGTPTNATSATVSGLASNTQYYAYVRNSCGTSFSGWERVTFTTAPNPCRPVTGITYNAPTASNASFSWTAVPGSQGYQYALTSSPTHPTTGIVTTAATGGAESGLTGGGSYYLHVRNICSPNSVSDWETVNIKMPECNTPTNIIVSNITTVSADVIWSVMSAANSYQYVVDQSREAPFTGSGASTTLGMSAYLSGLTPNTKYYVHIRSQCFINDVSEWALDSFITQAYCAAPELTVTNPGTSTPFVSWNTVDGAVSYEYAISSSTTPPAFGTEISTTNRSFPLPNDGKNYYVHVRTKCFSQFTFSAWSTEVLREIVTGVDDVNGNNAILVAYPNPVTSKLTVDIATPQANATISLLDLTGKVLQQSAVSGNKFEADYSSLAPGIYLLKYSSDTGSQTIRINKQ